MAQLSAAVGARSRPARWSRGVVWGGVLASQLWACKGSRSEELKQNLSDQPQLAAEPERFEFVLPPDYVPRELRGEGSETLRAPAQARVQPHENGVSVEAGSDFALEIQFQPPAADLPTALEGAQRAHSESDLVVFKAAGAYWFVVLRELVPEWDESERRRVWCGSAGATAPARAELRRFSHSAVERMVAACRSLALPRLE